MRVIGVIEEPNGTYQVNSVFRDRELAVVIEAGLRSLLHRGQLPFEKIGEVEENLFRVLLPSELSGKANEIPEDTLT